jgi:hypothetical protein
VIHFALAARRAMAQPFRRGQLHMSVASINSIQNGIIFLMAKWSGPAVIAYRELLIFLEKNNIPPDQLHVFDIDLHQELNDMPEFIGKIHGWGETAVVKDGKIILVIVLGKNQNMFQQHCDELLRAYSA